MAKLPKSEILKRLETLRNTALCDSQKYESMLVDNEVYDPSQDDYIPLTREARLVIIEAKVDADHILNRLNEILND